MLTAFAPPRPLTATGLAHALTEWAVATAEDVYIFHAAALERDGRGLLLPGGSGAGKTTLAAGLMGRGFRLYSDEAGVLTFPGKRLQAYPRQLSVRSQTWGMFRDKAFPGKPDESVWVTAEMFGQRAEAEVAPALMVLPRYRPGSLEGRRLTTGECVTALMAVSCSQPRYKVAGFDWVIELARQTPAYHLESGDLEQSLEQIEQWWDEVLHG